MARLIPPLRTSRLDLHLRELRQGEAMDLREAPHLAGPARAEAMLTAFLEIVAGPDARPRAMTLQERYRVVAHYNASVSDEGRANFPVATGRLGDYLPDLPDAPPPEALAAGGLPMPYAGPGEPIAELPDAWGWATATGGWAELLEAHIPPDGGAWAWHVGLLAVQARHPGLEAPPDLDAAGPRAPLDWLGQRQAWLMALPASEFAHLFTMAGLAREREAHLLRLALADAGPCVLPATDTARGSDGKPLPPARFPLSEPAFGRIADGFARLPEPPVPHPGAADGHQPGSGPPPAAERG